MSTHPADGGPVGPGGPDLTVTVRETSAALVVGLSGELDIASLPVAERAVEQAERAAPPVLAIDLSPLEFVDSTGVRLVLLAAERARGAGRALVVVLGRGLPRRVFDTLGLTERLDVVTDLAELDGRRG